MNDKPNLYLNKENCCGCKACANICPKGAVTFADDEYGFSYPRIDSAKCVGCNLCVKICDFQQQVGVKRSYPLKSFAAAIKDKDILEQSSSGGVFTALAMTTLENKGAVFGCVLNERNEPVHTCVTNESDLEKMRGSKYAQSDVGFAYNEVKRRLLNGQDVLFTGTPCQVAALRSFLGESKYDNLLTVDLVCHGVPSAAMFQQYIAYLEHNYKWKISKYRFRSKARGWGNFVQEVDVHSDGDVKKKYIGSNSEFYLPNFRKGNLNRPSCYQCKYACPERAGDFTIGDFWGYKKADIKIKAAKGLSVCLVNTEHGNDYIPAINKFMDLETVETAMVIQGNRQLQAPMKTGSKWEYYMNAMREGQISNVADEYKLKNKRVIAETRIKDLIPNPILEVLHSIKQAIKGKE